MRDDGFDVYPILHGGKVYNLITPLDLTFTEVHRLLDWLEERSAFAPDEGGDAPEPGRLFAVDLGDATYDVDVQGLEMVVYRKTPA